MPIDAKPPVKHLIRQIAAKSNLAVGYQSVDEVDAYLSSLALQGYKIISTHFLGAQTDTSANVQYFGVLYILQLDPTEMANLKKARSEKVE